jgi:hypothetical protein
MKECINHKSYEFCWNLNIFEAILKKFISNTKYAQNHQGFFTVCVNHNKEQDGGWKSFVSLKFKFFTTSCYKCNKSFNFKISFYIKPMKIRFCELILLVKFRCNKDHIHGENWILAYKSRVLVESFSKSLGVLI